MSSQPDRQVFLSVDEPFTGSISSDILGDAPGASTENWLEEIAEAALGVALGSTEAGQISLLITDDETIRSLNAKYRGLDEVTDVLSFSTDHPGHWEGDEDPPDDIRGFDFILPPGEISPLGEVIVSFPQAKRQAEQQGVPLEYELALLVVHGVLHLTGHDHLEPEETALMQSKERTALTALNIGN